MLKLQSAWWRHFGSVLTVVRELLRDGWQLLNVAVGSRTALTAEILFLRKQLAYYQVSVPKILIPFIPEILSHPATVGKDRTLPVPQGR
jgi:hypothetical protein